MFPFSQASRLALELDHLPVQCVSRTPSAGVKRPGREVNHLLPGSAAAKNEWNYTATPPYAINGVHMDNFN
jgi:hypothetical protein